VFLISSRRPPNGEPIELLVDVVDVILEGSGIDEKFLGVTLFALVPNTTEFMNAISFALNGNIALRFVL
jgi:Ca2+:H+ antiporter